MASADSARAPEGRRLALVIANGVYDADSGLAALRGPEVDARRLSAALEDPLIGGFAVDAVIDRPSSEVKSKLETFLAEARPRDLVVVYLSCHGLIGRQDQALYFAALDTRRASLKTTATQARLVTEMLNECRALRKVLILDCCYSGAFAKGAKGGGPDVGAELIGSGQGLVVLTSSRDVQESYEDEDVDGAFTSVFTAGLVDGMQTGEADRDRDGWISLDEAYHYACEYVQARRPEQNPQRWMTAAEGVIYLARSNRAEAPTPGAGREAASADSKPVPLATPKRALKLRLVRELTGHRGHVHDAAFSQDGKLLVTGGGDGSARLWDCTTRELRKTAVPRGTGGPLTAVAFSPDGAQFAAGGFTTTVHLWDVHDATLAATLKGASDVVCALEYSPSSALLAAGCEDGAVCLWHPSTGRLARTLESDGGPVAGLAFSSDGRMLAAAVADGGVCIWDPVGGELLRQLNTRSDETLGIAFGGDSTRLFVGGQGVVEVWDVDDAQRVAELATLTSSLVVSVHVSPNGQLVAGAGERGELWLWDASDGTLRATQHAHTGGAADVVFHPNGRMLCSVGADARVCLWELSAIGG